MIILKLKSILFIALVKWLILIYVKFSIKLISSNKKMIIDILGIIVNHVVTIVGLHHKHQVLNYVKVRQLF